MSILFHFKLTFWFCLLRNTINSNSHFPNPVPLHPKVPYLFLITFRNLFQNKSSKMSHSPKFQSPRLGKSSIPGNGTSFTPAGKTWLWSSVMQGLLLCLHLGHNSAPLCTPNSSFLLVYQAVLALPLLMCPECRGDASQFVQSWKAAVWTHKEKWDSTLGVTTLNTGHTFTRASTCSD